MKSNWAKGIGTVVGAIILSTLGIFASDSLQGIDSRINNLAGVQNAGVCNEGSVALKMDSGIICVDVYEASPSVNCPHAQLKNIIESEQNANAPDCYAASVKGAIPWNYISLPQAQRMCAGAGKRLPRSTEWYRSVIGTNSETCIIRSSTIEKTGTEACISGIGVHDAIGNVWEWVDENVNGNTFDGRQLPQEGYVTGVDANGIAITSGTSADQLYGTDYFWSKEEGIFGMIRGGYYGSNQDAGLYTVNASVSTAFATQGVGFRCVKDVL